MRNGASGNGRLFRFLRSAPFEKTPVKIPRGRFLTAISQAPERAPPRRRMTSSNATEPPSILAAYRDETPTSIREIGFPIWARQPLGKVARKVARKFFLVTVERINVSIEGRELSAMTCFFFRSNRKAQATLSGVYGRDG